MQIRPSNRAPDIGRWLPLLAGVLLAILSACAREGEKAPNLVLIVVDTLRADHLGAYGYERPTSPVIDRELAERGVLFENTYAQAPWTLPSMASLLTGIDPNALLDDEGEAWGIPESAATLAERLAQSGYTTAAFVANPTLHEGNGFSRGFQHFYSPPLELASFDRHGDELADQMIDWLAGGRAEPYFLYLHFLDPHDPYANEDIHDCATAFDPSYAGDICGDEIRDLALGRKQLGDPQRDARHLEALYDTEIRFVDRQIGRALEALEDQRLGSTLFAFTSDHGEELFDHGSFRHGETLYDELIRVPLILRWDGRLPAGRRVGATTRLLDLHPTFLSAAGLHVETSLRGVDLLEGLLSPSGLLELPAFASHLSAGPLRHAVVHRGRKLILFDRQATFAPADDHEAALWQRDRARLPRYELLHVDSRGETGTPAVRPEEASAADLEESLIRHLDNGLPSGARFLATGLPEGSELRLRLRASSTDGAQALFLGEADELVIAGGEITLSLVGEPGPKMLLLPYGSRSIDILEITLDERELPLIWARESLPGPISLDGSESESLAPRPRGPALRFWYRSTFERAEKSDPDSETLERLKALGYLK